VVRRVEKANAAKDAQWSKSRSPSNSPDAEVICSTSSVPRLPPAVSRQLQWIYYSTAPTTSLNHHDTGLADEEDKAIFELAISQRTIPSGIKQDAQEASISFFFRHYRTTICDNNETQLAGGFHDVWLPLYTKAAPGSPLRVATVSSTEHAPEVNRTGLPAIPPGPVLFLLPDTLCSITGRSRACTQCFTASRIRTVHPYALALGVYCSPFCHENPLLIHVFQTRLP
jgi:hypothetical protein